MQLTEQSEYLIYLVEKGSKERYGEVLPQDIVDRLKYELNVIVGKGFSEYFLILADMASFCRREGIAMAPGRGSSGGSAVAYTTYITDVDPIRHQLIFDRFLNSERKALPDIDTDICWANRQRVIDYLVSRYGEDKTAQIVTFNTLQPKVMLQDVGRVLQIPLKEVEMLKKLVPDHEAGSVSDLLEDPAFRKAIDKVAAHEPRLVKTMLTLEGLHRNESLHAGGVIIAREPITTFMPTFRKGGKGRLAVQYEMDDAKVVGGLKMDILGLKTVTLIDWAEKDIRRRVDPNFRTRGYREDDQAAFDIINRGDTSGIFQLEGHGITAFAQELGIHSFADIAVLLALYRPGPLDSGMAHSYIRRKHGQEQVTYPHPDLIPVLQDTYGIIIYQEQVMFILGVMAGYSMGQADKMRKAMGEKIEELMKEELAKFREAAVARGYDPEVVDKIAHLIETFARYGFNKSHAVEYGYLTYWTAVIKARCPAAFYAAWLNVTEEAAKRGFILDQAERRNLVILPPDVNTSDRMFTMMDPETIRFGLEAVSGMGDSFVDKTLASRDADGSFASYYDYCRRLTSIPVDKKEALVASGAFGFDGQTRAFLMTHARPINEAAKKKSQFSYDNFMPVPEYASLELAELEHKYTQYYFTANPIKAVQSELRLMGAEVGAPTESLVGRPLIGGRVTKAKGHKTGTGKAMAFVSIDDGIESHDVTVFPELWTRYQQTLAEGNVVLMRCDVGAYKGKKSLSALHIEPLDITDRRTKLVIDMGRNIGPLYVAQLRYILAGAASGKSGVEIRMRNGRHRLKTRSRSLQITVTDDIIAQIRSIFGPASVSLRPEV